jgi:hypothetical protein
LLHVLVQVRVTKLEDRQRGDRVSGHAAADPCARE